MTAAEKKVAIAKKKAELAEIEAMEASDAAPKEVSALDAMLARLNSPEMTSTRDAQLADVKPDPAAKFRNVVSADDFYNADKRMDQKRKEFTAATGIEVDDDEDFEVNPPESDAQRAERIRADKMLAELKAAGEKMKKTGPVKIDPKTLKPLDSSKLVKGPDGTLKPNSKEFTPADLPSEKEVLAGREKQKAADLEERIKALEERVKSNPADEESAVMLEVAKAEKQEGDTPLAERSTAEERMLAALDKMDGTPTTSEDPTGEEFDTAFDDKMPEGTDGMSSDVDVSNAAKAVPVNDMDAMNLFRVVHGGDFDPKSSMDKTKLAKIQENLVKDEYKGLSPNQFALRMYREAA